MQFDVQRAFPYPVLRPYVDDYVDGEFQAIVDMTHPDGSENIQLGAQFALSVDEIAALIDRGKASFVLVVACRDTYTSNVIRSAKSRVSERFATGDLRGEVVISPYIVAEEQISEFRCPLINSEFGEGPFSFQKGAVVAVDEPKAVYVDRDLFKPITSIFELVRDENLRGAEWRVNFSGPRVQIGLSASLKEKIDRFRNNPKNRAILINSVYFAAVMQCIHNLRDSEYGDLRWAQIMRQQCHNQNIDIEKEPEYLVAERLLKFPLALLDTHVFRETQE
jgi:hypothetical protein